MRLGMRRSWGGCWGRNEEKEVRLEKGSWRNDLKSFLSGSGQIERLSIKIAGFMWRTPGCFACVVPHGKLLFCMAWLGVCNWPRLRAELENWKLRKS